MRLYINDTPDRVEGHCHIYELGQAVAAVSMEFDDGRALRVSFTADGQACVYDISHDDRRMWQAHPSEARSAPVGAVGIGEDDDDLYRELPADAPGATCPRCAGSGDEPRYIQKVPCFDCRGSGTATASDTRSER